MQGTSILEDHQVGRKARRNYEKQLKKFTKSADHEKRRLKTDLNVDECLVDLLVESFLMAEHAYVGEKTMAAFQVKFPDFGTFGNAKPLERIVPSKVGASWRHRGVECHGPLPCGVCSA